MFAKLEILFHDGVSCHPELDKSFDHAALSLHSKIFVRNNSIFLKSLKNGLRIHNGFMVYVFQAFVNF